MTLGKFVANYSMIVSGCLFAFVVVLISFKNNPDNIVTRILEEKVIERTIESCKEIKEGK